MSEKYDHKKIEKKWQEIWERLRLYKTKEDRKKNKYYCLVMFPYPSGDLHVGHWYNFGPGDTVARFSLMKGKNVLHPVGFDAFGLPAENAAIKHNLDPKEWTYKNIEKMTRQLKSFGPTYDWSRSVITSEPDYYKWTQWFFLLMYKKGLAYKKRSPVNFCPSCNTSLANEQVVGGKCERCETEVVTKELEQWFFKITKYAEKLLSGLKKIDWPEKIKIMQENWIGRSEGADVKFKIDGKKNKYIEVFTTRADTLFGATYMVLAPENPLVSELTKNKQKKKVESYIKKTKGKTELERMAEIKEKTGVFIGSYTINPVNGRKIPIWISDYVLTSYGTGAIMAVPAHDERDFEFAKRFDLPIVEVVSPNGKSHKLTEAYIGEGALINSQKFDGVSNKKAAKEIVKWLAKKKLAKESVNYKLRDWLVSRQRYWGAPIPIIYCEKCGTVPVPEKDLPVVLPLGVKFKPTGESPLKEVRNFINTKCPQCDKKAKRETDTLDTFVCSSWYYLRYTDVNYEKGPFNREKVDFWLPVDQYIGGAEHAVLHLLYSRFFTKVLYDEKLVNFDEPFTRLFNQGTILGPDGQKMSKSRGNVVDPDEYVRKYGADTVRAYLCFMGPYDEGGPWDPNGVLGVSRFLNKAWNISLRIIETQKTEPKPQNSSNSKLKETKTEITRRIHQTIKKVTLDLEGFRFNTALSTLMEYVNFLTSVQSRLSFTEGLKIYREAVSTLVILLAPITPHISEELWQRLGNKESIFKESWPKYDKKLIKEEVITLVVQVNGKVRDTISVPSDIKEDQAKKAALESTKIKEWLKGKSIKRVIFVSKPGERKKLINIVV